MKKFKLLSVLLILLLLTALLPTSALAAEEPEISAAAATVVNASTGEVYYAKNADAAVMPASTTKMVTAMLVAEAVERGDIALTDVVTASDNCQYNLDSDSTNAGPAIVPGEEMTVEELLYCAMLVSANEACNILAEYVSGSVSAFVDAMNARASELGCAGTHFTNANGLEDSGHYTTAADFAILASEALKSSLVLQVCGTLTHTVPATNVADARELTNTNSLLNPDSGYYSEYAYGVKTGYFTNAGYCLVSAADRNDIDVICVVMGSPEPGGNFADSLTLYDWMFENFENRPILSTTATLMPVAVALGTEDTTGVRADSVVSAILPLDYDTSRIQMQAVLYHERDDEELIAPVNAGQVLGEVTVVEVDENNRVVRTFGTSLLVATSTVDMSRMEYLRSQVQDLFQTPVVRRLVTILIILLAVYILLVFFYTVQRMRHLHSVRQAKRERAERRIAEEAQWLQFPEEESADIEIDYFDDPGKAADESPKSDYFDTFFDK